MAEDDAHLDPDYARFYDWTWQDYDADIAFYTRLAEQHGPPVLEAACGTGRLTIPLARAGFEVVGFDHSPAMLDLARAKLGREQPEVRDRVEFCEADMCDLDLGRQFDCVFLPHASLFLVAGRVALTRCFRGLYAHTRPGGVAVVDVVAPERMKDQDIGHQVLVGEGINPATGRPTRESKLAANVSWDTQTVRVDHIFVEGEEEAREESVFAQRYRWLEKEEGVGLLRRTGFPEIEILGDFDGAEFTEESPRLILVAHRLERDVL